MADNMKINRVNGIPIEDTELKNNVEVMNNELTSQIDQKASDIDLSIERKRIDSFTRLEEGSTTGDAELIDGRIGADGVIYENLGGAIRSQVGGLTQDVYNLNLTKNKVILDFNKNTSTGYLNKKGELINGIYESGMCCIYTDPIVCKEGDVFLYKGRGEANTASCLFKNNSELIGYGQYDSRDTYTEVVIPSGVNKVIFTSFTYSTNVEDVVFDLKLGNATLEDRISVVENKNELMNDTLENIEANLDCTELALQYYTLNNGYIYYSNGEVAAESGTSTYTDLIKCSIKDTFYVSGHSQYFTGLIATYDANQNFLRAYGYDTKGASINHVDYEFIPKEDEKFARFSSYQTTVIVKKLILISVSEYINKRTQNLFNANILYGKKYVACGDSFTEGDFSGYTDENGLSGKNSPVIYDSDWKMYKTYPWWIAKRNEMTLVNEAKCGSDFTNVDGASNPFSVSRYQAVPTDADYITIMFGLNESNLTDEQIGTKTDTTNATLWGAYNIVFEYFLTNMPYAKIGVILPDAWLPEKYANAVIEICRYWGIPYLNLKGDDSVTMGLGGKFTSTSSTAKSLRNAAFQVTSSNSHPNLEAHKFRSTIIENFLRSL